MTIDELKQLLDEYIKENGVGAITGPILNNVLTQILDYISAHGGGGGDITIIDDLTSYLADAALSANMGRVLKEAIDSIAIPPAITVVDSLDSESATSALSANQGRILKALIDSGQGLNYMRLSMEEYEELRDAGELSDDILYIVP